MGHHTRKFLPLLSALLDGELGEDERRRVESHIEGCEECKEILIDFRRLREIGAAARPYPVNPYYLTRLKATLRGGVRDAWEASEIEAKLFGPMLAVLVVAIILLFSVTEGERAFSTDDYLFGGRKTLVEQQLLSRQGKVSQDEILLLTVSTPYGEEQSGR